MNKRELFSVALKVMGVGFFVSFIQNVIQFFVVLNALYRTTPSILNIFSTSTMPFGLTVTYAVMSYAFIKESDKIAKKFIAEETKMVVTKEDIILVIVALQGISLIVGAGFRTISSVVVYILYIDVNSPFQLNQYSIQLIIDVSASIIGIWMLLSAPKVSQFLWNKILKKFWK